MDLEVLNRLENFRLSEEEEAWVDIELQDVKSSVTQCKQSLVGRVFGEHSVNFTGLKQTLSKLWCGEGDLKVIELQNRMYQFVFSREEERLRVLNKRPWTFDNQLLVLHPWRKGIEHETKTFLSSYMWVQAWQIPAQWLSVATVRKVGHIFKQCHNVIIPENGSKDGRYAKLLVEIDLNKPLIRGTRLRCNGEMCWISFKYEQLPYFCFYCGKIGHGERICEKKKEDSQKSCLTENQFGEWLRGQTGRGFQKKKTWGVQDGVKIVAVTEPKEKAGGDVGVSQFQGTSSGEAAKKTGQGSDGSLDKISGIEGCEQGEGQSRSSRDGENLDKEERNTCEDMVIQKLQEESWGGFRGLL